MALDRLVANENLDGRIVAKLENLNPGSVARRTAARVCIAHTGSVYAHAQKAIDLSSGRSGGRTCSLRRANCAGRPPPPDGTDSSAAAHAGDGADRAQVL